MRGERFGSPETSYEEPAIAPELSSGEPGPIEPTTTATNQEGQPIASSEAVQPAVVAEPISAQSETEFVPITDETVHKAIEGIDAVIELQSSVSHLMNSETEQD